MGKIFKSLILILFLSLFESAFSYSLNRDELSNILYLKLQGETKEMLEKYSADFKLTLSIPPFETIQTNDNTIPKIEILAPNQSFSPNTYRRVIVKDLNNDIVKSFTIGVRTLVYKEVLVADKQINFEDEINSKNTKLEKREIGKYLTKTLNSVNEGTLSARNYTKGSIILSDGIKQKILMAKNSTINIIFLSQKGIKIRVQGKALKGGALGDTITVRSDKYNRIYDGIINSSKDVIVRI